MNCYWQSRPPAERMAEVTRLSIEAYRAKGVIVDQNKKSDRTIKRITKQEKRDEVW
jgi:prophage tail gpP-like protein